MDWTQLLCEKRSRSYVKRQNKSDLRNEFQKDYHRILSSASFRRLQDKTQVFPLEQNDFVRTRLTHSLEVASFAKSLGQMAFQTLLDQNTPGINAEVREKVCSILECAGLLHDIGNPPFGHFGEDSIRNWFCENLSHLRFRGQPVTVLMTEQMQNDLYHFEGNAQALRLITKLHYLIDENGMHLTYALLNTLIKYPVSSCEVNKERHDVRYKKMGYYLAEEEKFREITESTGAVGCRYPLTYLLEAADDIAYLTADTEDAVKKGVLTYQQLLHELKERRPETSESVAYDALVQELEQKLETAVSRRISDPEMNAVQNWVICAQSVMLRAAAAVFVEHYEEIMNGTFRTDLLSVSDAAGLTKAITGIARAYIYDNSQILTLEVSAGNIIHTLMDHFIPAAIHLEDKQALTPRESRLNQIISQNYRDIYTVYAKGQDECCRLYLRLLLVTDYICGMTDSYAKRMYQQFRGIM